MPRVIFQVGEEERRLYVQAAHRELVTLSEWLRRAAEVRLNGGLAAGDLTEERQERGTGSRPGSSHAGASQPTDSDGAPTFSPSPAASPRCTREARHHINHSGKPCPECGYPQKGTE